jgi:HPt (histidine-containing phosphotransfer) domain-containing protein
MAAQPEPSEAESGIEAQPPPIEPETPRHPGEVLQPAALERLVRITGEDPGLLTALIETFASEVPRLLASARRGLQQRKADEVRRAAHTLKSNGATFGAMNLAELSRALEALARSGTLDGMADLIARIEAEFEAVKIALETLRERGGR